MIVYENEFVSMEVESMNGIFIERFKPSTIDMTPKAWKDSQIKLRELFLLYNVDKILCLGQEFNFIITPNLQDWQSQHISANVTKLKKMALVMPKDFVTQLSVEQLMEEKNTSLISTSYFKSELEARKWLMDD